MAEQSISASGNDEKKVSRANSFTKLMRSPLSSKSLKKGPSGNPLTRLLFGRKSSKKKGNDGEGEGSTVGGDFDEDENAPSLIEEVKEVVETAIDDVIHRDDKHTSVEPTTDAAIPTNSQDESSTDGAETKEIKHSLLDKFKEELLEVSEQPREIIGDLLEKSKEGLENTNNEDLKEDYGKIRAELKQILQKDIKPSVETSLNKKSSIDEGKTPIIDTKKGETTTREAGEDKEEKKKEDGCVSSLAEGLEKMCASWSSKKQD